MGCCRVRGHEDKIVTMELGTAHVWLYLRERHLSLRLLPDTEAIVDACCEAWNALLAETDRLRSLCFQPWIRQVIQ